MQQVDAQYARRFLLEFGGVVKQAYVNDDAAWRRTWFRLKLEPEPAVLLVVTAVASRGDGVRECEEGCLAAPLRLQWELALQVLVFEVNLSDYPWIS